MASFDQKHDRMIEYLRAALVLADQLKDSTTGHLIERAFDAARATFVYAEISRPAVDAQPDRRDN